jgi:FtsZ-binding cell division protein ZapB
MDLRSDEIVGGLKEKIKTIVSLFEVEKSRNDVLKEKNLELTSRVVELENKLDDLDKKYENIKIAKVLSSVPGEDVHETKLQVNRIVREIDKCIALLNR